MIVCYVFYDICLLALLIMLLKSGFVGLIKHPARIFKIFSQKIRFWRTHPGYTPPLLEKESRPTPKLKSAQTMLS